MSHCLPHHSVALPTTKHLILLPLWDQLKGGLLFGFFLLLSCVFFHLLLLFWRFILCSFFLLFQLELKVLLVALGALVLGVWENVRPTETIVVDYKKVMTTAMSPMNIKPPVIKITEIPTWHDYMLFIQSDLSQSVLKNKIHSGAHLEEFTFQDNDVKCIAASIIKTINRKHN